jgi:hypothetical protein
MAPQSCELLPLSDPEAERRQGVALVGSARAIARAVDFCRFSIAVTDLRLGRPRAERLVKLSRIAR